MKVNDFLSQVRRLLVSLESANYLLTLIQKHFAFPAKIGSQDSHDSEFVGNHMYIWIISVKLQVTELPH